MTAVTELEAQFANGRLTLKAGDYRKKAATFGKARRVPIGQTAAGRVAREIPEAKRKKFGITTPASKTVQVGEAPEGFGKYVAWSDEDSQLALVVFLNAGDPMGVGVLGVKATDTIQFVSAVGHASFSESTENKGVPAMIGIVAAGAKLTAASFGLPEAAPVIEAGSAYAKEQFKEKNVKTMVRDPYGEDPSSHHKAKKEGGVLVCSPSAWTAQQRRGQEVLDQGAGRQDRRQPSRPRPRGEVVLPLAGHGHANVLRGWGHVPRGMGSQIWGQFRFLSGSLDCETWRRATALSGGIGRAKLLGCSPRPSA